MYTIDPFLGREVFSMHDLVGPAVRLLNDKWIIQQRETLRWHVRDAPFSQGHRRLGQVKGKQQWWQVVAAHFLIDRPPSIAIEWPTF